MARPMRLAAPVTRAVRADDAVGFGLLITAEKWASGGAAARA
jgi:hypothetical protein